MGKKKKQTFEHLHAKPVTRREFLASGLIPFSASLFMPSWMDIFARAGIAQAQDIVCGAGSASTMAPFISIKLSGGAAMSANYVPLDSGGGLLATYDKIGLGTGSQLVNGKLLTTEFSNGVYFYTGSGILAGVRSAATDATLKLSSFVGVPVRSQDDSSGNKFEITGLVAKAGLAGKILPNLGRANTPTGTNNSFAYLKPPSPLIVSTFDDISGALGVNGSLAALSASQKNLLFNSIKGMSGTQALALQGQSGGAVLSQLVQCGHQDNARLIASADNLGIDPLANAKFATVWNITANTSKSSQDYVFASMVYNALMGNSGAISLEMGGFDYHDGTRTSGDAKDQAAGTVIGKVLESMAVLGKRGFVMVTSDGSVSSAVSDSAGAPWMSDRGLGGSAYMIAFDPVKAPDANNKQLGQFDSGQAADTNFITGGSAEIAAGAIFANYLSFNGQLGTLENHLPRVFSAAQVDLITILAKKA